MAKETFKQIIRRKLKAAADLKDGGDAVKAAAELAIFEAYSKIDDALRRPDLTIEQNAELAIALSKLLHQVAVHEESDRETRDQARVLAAEVAAEHAAGNGFSKNTLNKVREIYGLDT